MKVKVTVHVYCTQYSWEPTGQYQVIYTKLDDDEFRTHVCEQEIEIEVPDGYDPRAQKIEALQEKKRKIMADYQKTVSDINHRINNLQALEHTA